MMTLNTQDWKKLQRAVISLFLVCLIVGFTIFSAMQFSEEQTLAAQMQTAQYHAAHQKFIASGAEKNSIIEYLPQYQTLINQGFIGEEHRNDWINTLHAQQQYLQLFPIEYELSQLQDFKPDFVSNIGEFRMQKSIMKFQFDMLHEGDILQLLQALKEKRMAASLLRECEIERIAANTNLTQTLAPTLHAQCEIYWITLREPSHTP